MNERLNGQEKLTLKQIDVGKCLREDNEVQLRLFKVVEQAPDDFFIDIGVYAHIHEIQRWLYAPAPLRQVEREECAKYVELVRDACNTDAP